MECPLWVISGHPRRKKSCPLYPQKQTCAVHQRMSAKCQKRTSDKFERQEQILLLLNKLT